VLFFTYKMPKLIDYPRTNYTGAWELAEVVDDTGGKCAIETAARKLNRKVSGSFKAIIGSAVKFGLMTSKRELLSTTTLFKRIKHAYDKQEELQFHREAFLTPPLFTQICRKFRGRELPIQMLDVMLIREFGVEEINAQSVAKAFVEGCRMCALLDDHNIMADIDALNSQRLPRRELASPTPIANGLTNRTGPLPATQIPSQNNFSSLYDILNTASGPDHTIEETQTQNSPIEQSDRQLDSGNDAVSTLFGLGNSTIGQTEILVQPETQPELVNSHPILPQAPNAQPVRTTTSAPATERTGSPQLPYNHKGYQLNITGPGVNTSLDVTHEEDISIAIALLEKIRRQLRAEQQDA
jgi:hypothetical protein